MTNEELNTALYEKMFAEQEHYRGWLLSQPAEEILNHSYECTVREDILLSMEMNDISDEQAAALLKSPTPLGDIFKEFERRETGYMETVMDCITDRANTVIKAEQEQYRALLEAPLYKYPGSYARENNELDVYRTSHKANIACRDAIDNAISENYRDNCLGSDTAKQVIAKFGFDRTLYVLANTVREKDWDGRIDQGNKEWARTIPIFDDNDGFGDNRNREFIVSKSHPGLLNLFVTQARWEYQLSLSQVSLDNARDKASVLKKLKEAQPEKTPLVKASRDMEI